MCLVANTCDGNIHLCCCFELDNTKDAPDKVLPIFITVDPARDDVKTVAEYIKGKTNQFSNLQKSKHGLFLFIFLFRLSPKNGWSNRDRRTSESNV